MRHDRATTAPVRDGESVLTRRSLLARAGWAAGAAILPVRALLAVEAEVSPVMAKLTAYMCEARDRALPDEPIEKAKHHILDTFAAIISGSQLPGGLAAINFARSYGGGKVATVIASNALCDPINAALANGTMGHSDETDDYNGFVNGHLGAPIVAATLAAGEQFGINGAQFLRAVVLGYDIGPRFAMTLRSVSSQKEGLKYAHGVPGTFGAAAAAGCAAALNPEQMRLLLDYAMEQCSGFTGTILRDSKHNEKGFVSAGMLARSGVTAALVVKSGWTGVNDVLSGPDNLFLNYSPQADPSRVLDRLGERYEVTRTALKKWSAGAPAQAPLDGLDTIMKRRPFEADQVQKITVHLAAREAFTVNDREMPDINLQYVYALMLVDKKLSFQSVHDRARMQDPEIVRQRAKVQIIKDEQLAPLTATVEVTLADGTVLAEHVDAVRGTPQNPMTRDEVVAKARGLISPVLGSTACAGLIKEVLALENVENVRQLRPLLQRA